MTDIHKKNVFEREIAENQETLKDILTKEKGTQIEYLQTTVVQANGDKTIKIEEVEQSEVFEPKEAPVVKAIETGTILLID